MRFPQEENKGRSSISYPPKLPKKKIDNLMVQMKITPKTKITKKLLIDFLNNMKN